MNKEIPLLSATDVELRVAQIIQGKSGIFAILLCYKSARTDMRILDEVFGSMNWQRKHEVINGNLYCTVSIWDKEKGQWISKQDVGTESPTESEKSQSSDSFKRACVNIGIGRELYNSPEIRIKLNDDEVVMGNNGKPKTYAKFYVEEMTFDKELNKFTAFKVIDKDGEVRFNVNPSNKQIEHKTAPTKVIDAPPPYVSNNVCCQCHATIKSSKVLEYAIGKYGVPICYDCQKKMNAA